jgi:hypothetical protein
MFWGKIKGNRPRPYFSNWSSKKEVRGIPSIVRRITQE